MRRETAVKYAHEIARRLHSVNGLLATPDCEFEAVRIARVWVFGSTVKGSLTPGDLDILIDIRPVGRRTRWVRGRKLDREYSRRYGFDKMPDSRRYALLWLTRGMRLVSRHTTDVEEVEIDVKRLIYPRFDGLD